MEDKQLKKHERDRGLFVLVGSAYVERIGLMTVTFPEKARL